MTPLRIVHTESSLGWGGQEIRILSESQGLTRRGHDVRLLCPAEAQIFREAPEWGVPVEALPIAKKRLGGVRAMIGWLKAHPVDVVSTHSSTDSWLSALALQALGHPVPMVRTRHISAPVHDNLPTRWLYTKATSRIVTAGEALRRQLIEENGFPASRIESVPTGVDVDKYRPGPRDAARASLRLPQDKTLVGIVATLRSWKGHRYLIEALAGLPRDVHLVIVGEGPNRVNLEPLIDQLGLRPRVLLPGNQRNVVPWLQALDIFALPSYANEGVPQALLQAMLTGLPCVTTATGSIWELARHEETALVVPPRDSAALRAALERLIAGHGLAKRLGDAARTHCAERFSQQAMLNNMERIYAEAAGKMPAGMK